MFAHIFLYFFNELIYLPEVEASDFIECIKDYWVKAELRKFRGKQQQ